MAYCDVCKKYIERPRTFIGDDGYEYKVCLQCLLELRREQQREGGPPREPPMCECQRCKGKGRVPAWVVAGNIVITWRTCPICKGKGEVRC